MNVYNRRSFKLKQRRIANPPEMWIRKGDAFEAIVPLEQFLLAQEIIHRRSKQFSDAEMLDRLRSLYQRYGTLSGILIDETEAMPSSSAYRSRFNSLIRAYQLVGFTPARDFTYVELNRVLRRIHTEQCEKLLSEIRGAGASVHQNPATELFSINDEFTLSLIVARCNPTQSGSLRWLLRFETSLRPDVTAAIRLEPNNRTVRDCYLFPGTDILTSKLRLGCDNGVLIDLFRFEDLRFVVGMGERVRIARVA